MEAPHSQRYSPNDCCRCFVCSVGGNWTAAIAKPPPCSSGWDEVTRTGVVDLPLFRQGIGEGLFTGEELRAGLDSFDTNGDEYSVSRPRRPERCPSPIRSATTAVQRRCRGCDRRP